ncbi:GntR family transcriptional regulator [Methylobacterium radiodurans]|uniref:GntR family transcriptional regulator n=1 Tax=Methylobacterium radiodurans TaxID=2202828 RepID=A0A2U8VNR9_9HYPH|nr:GntR family transcriptional regulator [Methylobacterium radiodurans]AWN35200.1 GntR family transcriptional regulator [Methylobacterium radiodurans]
MTEIRRPRGRPRKVKPEDAQPLLVPIGLHERASQHLRELILTGVLAPGQELVEADLSATLGVSRTPVREALKLLAVEGLVELRPNRSARVPDLQAEAITQLFEAIAGIERIAAEFAAVRITDVELAHLRALQDEMEGYYRATDLAPYFVINQQIHRLIVSASRNRPLQEAHESLYGRAELVRRRALRTPERWDESVAEHRAIFHALEARDALRAGALLCDHVGRTGTAVLNHLSAVQRSPDKACVSVR